MAECIPCLGDFSPEMSGTNLWLWDYQAAHETGARGSQGLGTLAPRCAKAVQIWWPFNFNGTNSDHIDHLSVSWGTARWHCPSTKTRNMMMRSVADYQIGGSFKMHESIWVNTTMNARSIRVLVCNHNWHDQHKQWIMCFFDLFFVLTARIIYVATDATHVCYQHIYCC